MIQRSECFQYSMEKDHALLIRRLYANPNPSESKELNSLRGRPDFLSCYIRHDHRKVSESDARQVLELVMSSGAWWR